MIKNKKSTIIRFSALFLAVCILFSLFSCKFSTTPSTEEEIRANIAASVREDTKGYNYVGYYLDDWGFPDFDSFKLMNWAENVFKAYYNFNSGLPSTLIHAVNTAEHFLNNYYGRIDLTDRTAVTDALITSYVYVIGDPYSVYMTPVEHEEYDIDMSGHFGGIGVVVEYNHTDETIRVSSVNIDSPAEAAGFRVGDYVIAVDGESIDDIGYLNAIYKIRGKVGTNVTVTVLRGDEEIELTATRAIMVEVSVSYGLTDEGYGYILVTEFKDNTFSQFVEALDYMEEENVPGIIFDLRNNPGGYVHSVIDMLSYLIPNGNLILSYQYKGSSPYLILSENDVHPETGKTSDHVIDIPIVVLCNEYTASAAEIFTAAVRDYRDDGIITASIVGNNTYGKGVVQNTFTYTTADSSSLTLTTSYINPPSGVNYHGTGISPDQGLKVDNTETEDLQFDAAVEELQRLINGQ